MYYIKKGWWIETTIWVHKYKNCSLHWWVPDHTVLSRRPHRPGAGLSSRSTFPPRGCHRMGFPSGSVQGCCCCQCRSWPEHYGWQAPHSLHGCETPARAAAASVCQRQRRTPSVHTTSQTRMKPKVNAIWRTRSTMFFIWGFQMYSVVMFRNTWVESCSTCSSFPLQRPVHQWRTVPWQLGSGSWWHLRSSPHLRDHPPQKADGWD